jgi:histidine triad (HIT) family protein
MVSEKECIFCRIARGEIPCKKVFEDSESFAFLDISPRNPGHTLVIPKKHRETIMQMDEEDSGVLFMAVRRIAGKVMAATKAQGISIAQSNGPAAGQVVSHVHFHVIPRFANEGPPGIESIIPSKKLDEKSMEQLASAIRGSSGMLTTEAADEEPKEQTRPSQLAAAKPGQPQKKGFAGDDDVMDEEIDEDMFKF